MNTTPLVSVLIRTRDRTALLHQAVQSVVAQRYRPLEVIVVNDGNEHSEAALAALCTAGNVAFRWLDHPGRGRSAAANAALAAATGDYCLLLDDDDWLDADHIGNLVTALQQQPALLAAYSDVRTVAADGSTDDTAFNQPWDALRLRVENYLPIHAVLFARKLWQLNCRFDQTLERYEDWDFWLQVAQHTGFVHVAACTANYRVAVGSGFGAGSGEAVDQLRVALYRKWLPHWRDDDLLTLLDRSRQYPRLGLLQAENASLQASMVALQQAEQELTAKLRQQQQQLSQANKELAVLQGVQQQYAVEKAVTAALRRDLDQIYHSKSWRVTRPLRYLNHVLYLWRVEGTVNLLRRIVRKLLRPAPKLPKAKASATALRPIGPLQFTAHEQPLVSIVIPVFNKIGFTFHCLAAVRANSGKVPYEVIVVDDCSTDDTAQVLANIGGLRVLRNETNSGFIRTCNAGADAARGEFVLLLNNDTEPQPGWLDALVETFRDKPDCGMVGAKLLFADGSLQEAGGIVWRDGSAWNYGRGDDPNKPEYSYLRAADYCSGAVLMLRTTDFRALGQFDLHYLPAYYEDTDLAFQVRKAGKQVYYQPLAQVIHFEGITNGTDTGSGIKQHQVTNQRKFFERWQGVLQQHRANGQLPQLEKERAMLKRALVVDARVLMPDNDSGSLRMFNLLQILQSLGYKVTFIPDNLQYHERYTPMLQAIGVECWYAPYHANVAQHLQQHGRLYDVVLLSRADVAENNIDDVLRFAPQAKVLFDTVDLHFLRERRQAALSGNKLEAEAAELRRLQELGIARRAHTTLVVSPVEIEVFKQEAPDVNVALVSNIHAVHGRGQPWAAREHIVFIGSFEHPPNIDAMHYFIDDVFPLLQQRRPGIKLLIVGAHAPRSLTNKGNALIEFKGFVPELMPLFDSVRLSIAPLRYGAGVKGKINTSMAYGVPVVASTVAAEGMGLQHGVDVLVADTPQDFAAAIVSAYDDEAQWNRLSDAALANLERHFSFAVATAQLRTILDQQQ
ncbi:MAG TPA: glycosyltransferase [Candidatus Acidoferrum sp.]|nr:glycosyltransferase [Candidatus Acidoferrum sp.]